MYNKFCKCYKINCTNMQDIDYEYEKVLGTFTKNLELLLDDLRIQSINQAEKTLELGRSSLMNVYNRGTIPAMRTLIPMVFNMKKKYGKMVSLDWMLFDIGPRYMDEDTEDLRKKITDVLR